MIDLPEKDKYTQLHKVFGLIGLLSTPLPFLCFFYKRLHQLLVLTLFITYPLLLFYQLLETSPSGVTGDRAAPPVGLVPKIELVPVPILLQ